MEPFGRASMVFVEGMISIFEANSGSSWTICRAALNTIEACSLLVGAEKI
jgi:hypothetical protein